MKRLSKNLRQVLKSINHQDSNWLRKAVEILSKPDQLIQHTGAIVFMEALGKIRYLITNVDNNISFESFINYVRGNEDTVYYGKEKVWCFTHQSLSLKTVLEERLGIPIEKIVKEINLDRYDKDFLYKLAQESIVTVVDSRTRGRITPYRDAMIEYEKADPNFYKQMLLDKQVEEDTKVFVEDAGYIGTIAEVAGLKIEKIVASQLDKKEKDYRRFVQGRVLFGLNSWTPEQEICLSNQLSNQSPALSAWIFYNKD